MGYHYIIYQNRISDKIGESLVCQTVARGRHLSSGLVSPLLLIMNYLCADICQMWYDRRSNKFKMRTPKLLGDICESVSSIVPGPDSTTLNKERHFYSTWLFSDLFVTKLYNLSEAWNWPILTKDMLWICTYCKYWTSVQNSKYPIQFPPLIKPGEGGGGADVLVFTLN